MLPCLVTESQLSEMVKFQLEALVETVAFFVKVSFASNEMLSGSTDNVFGPEVFS